MHRMSASHSPLFIFLCISSFTLSFSAENNPVFCPEIEKQSLLSFKQSLQDPNDVLSTWNDAIDCCKWKGVICNNSTGHVYELHLRGFRGKMNPSLLNLKYLRHLDLSRNSFFGETIPSFIGLLESLEYLNLSGAGFGGKVPHTIGNLSNLRTLDLNAAPYRVLHVDSLDWLTGLSQLEHLNMDFTNLSEAYNWAQVITSLPSLVQVNFQSCSLDYTAPLDHVNSTALKHLYIADNFKSPISIPPWIFQLTNLVDLDLRGNNFVGQIPAISNATELRHIDLSFNGLNSSIPDWFYLCKDLEFLDLSVNRLNGTISSSIENLTSLNNLRLTSNELSGKIPKEISKLCKMRRLDLSENFFGGEISDSFGNMSDCFLESLEHLRLRSNSLSGQLTDQFGNFKSLGYLNVGWNSLSGVIPTSLGKLSSLENLWMQSNKFTGTLPESFGLLSSLQLLYINDNMLEGVVTETHFTNLTKLTELFASGNHLTLQVNPNWNPPFQLTAFHIASWNLGVGSRIPAWLESQKSIVDLDLSNTGISGSVPSLFWDIEILTLTHNNLSGKIPSLLGLNNSKYIYLGSNQFSGSLPRVTDTLRHLDLSSNSFSGGASHLLCDTTNQTYKLELLHLGGNQLSGKLPDCWMKWPSLEYLNLGDNNMSGSIPNSIGHLAELQSLNLYGNRFYGVIPFSMHNCTKLVKMDVGDNDLSGGMPTWVGTSLVELTFLVMDSNKLDGAIPPEICRLNSLQVLDLSDNWFSGTIPRCIYNFTGMATKRSFGRYRYSYSLYSWTFVESVSVAVKGSEFEYGNTLSLVTNIDLSRNRLSGDIPKELTSLLELRSLNLSWNRFTGSIPDSIGDMKQLESLDLSRNSVSGQIPSSFTLLSALNYLNLSFNNLTGEIPKSTQLQSLDASSFVGNTLCGPPLTLSCSDDGDGVGGGRKEEIEDGGGIEWFYVLLSLGYAVGLSVVCSALVLNKSWREAYFGFVDSKWNKLYVFVHIKWNRLTRPSDPSS